MKICLINAVCGLVLDTPEKLFAKYSHIPRLAAALQHLGHDVIVVQAYHDSRLLHSLGVNIHAIAAVRPSRVGGGKMVELSDFGAVFELLQGFDPNVVHFFGLTVERPLQQIVQWAKTRRKVVTASYHGGLPRFNPIARWCQRQVFRGVSALMFSAQEFSATWQSSGVVDRRTTIAILPEVSSPFGGVPKAEARRELGIVGDPVFAWAGRLHPVKDPLTALKGFSLINRKLPDAQLLMAYLDAPLLADVENYLRTNVSVGRKVTLLGKLPHLQIEVLFSAADFFVQSSLREIGGNSLVEALSCGAIPLVTDIPSFRILTNKIGPAKLFACGDAGAMAAALDDIDMTQLEQLSARIRADFNHYLSYPALAKKYEVVFSSALAELSGRRPT